MMSIKKANSCFRKVPDNQADCCNGASGNQSTCCGQNQQVCTGKNILIEFMYIDLTTCDRCIGTDTSLEEAIGEVSVLLQNAGYSLDVRKILVETEEQAQKLNFVSSPTIRINGLDIQLDFKESICGCCGEIAGEDIDCRVWLWQGQEYTTPPKAMLIDAILRHVYGGTQQTMEDASESKPIPKNLKKFFASKGRIK